MALGVSQNRLDLFGRDFKLFGDFSGAQAVVEVIHNGVDRHPRAAQHGRAAFDSRLDFDERAFRLINCFHAHHKVPSHTILTSNLHCSACAYSLQTRPLESRRVWKTTLCASQHRYGGKPHVCATCCRVVVGQTRFVPCSVRATLFGEEVVCRQTIMIEKANFDA